MTTDEYRAKALRLEQFAKEQPDAYRFRVMLLALLGYGYIFLILALVLAIVAAFFYLVFDSGRLNFLAFKFGWILLAFAAVIGRSLWVSFPTPEGEPLRESEAPRLFSLVRETQQAIAGPRVHQVVVTDELNAAIAQVPRLGLFGWPKNYLILGLPLLQALSPEQFRAVLAHEIGHLSGRHGRFTGWIYQVRRAWFQLLVQLEQNESWGQFIFTGFFNWYAPYFSAYTFVLARAQEYEADRDAAIVAGHENLASALVKVEIAGRLTQEDFYPNLMERARTEKEAPKNAYNNLFTELRGAASHRDAALWLRDALAAQTDYEDTHPALSDRLRALNCLPPPDASADAALLPKPPAVTAAAEYLGATAETLAPKLSVLWEERLRLAWRDQRRQLQEAEQALAKLEQQARAVPLKPEEAWQRAALTAQVKGNEAAMPLVEEIVGQQPENAEARYVMGRLLLQTNDEKGLSHLEQAMQMDINLITPACDAAYRFLCDTGRAAEAEAYRRRGQQHQDKAALAIAERQSVERQDTLLPHSLDAAQIADLRDQLAGHKEIAAAYLARKQLQHFPEKPFYLLALVTDTGWWGAEEKESELVEHLLKWLRFPGPLNLVLISRTNSWLADKFNTLPDAEIYSRQ